MVLLEIDIHGVGPIEFEGYTPRAVDVHRVPGWIKSTQAMEIESRKVDILKPCRSVEHIKSSQDALMHLGIDLARSAVFEQIGQTLVFERPDHGGM